MNIRLSQRCSSSLIGLLGLLGATAISVGTAAPAQAAGPAAPSFAGVPRATAGVAKTHFLGAHPLAGRPGTGYCYIDVPHVHDYVPDQPAVYQQVGDDYVFTGDPVPFGYEGEKTVFYGHHPVPVTVDVAPAARPPMTFCFIKGPHYHDYPQPEAPGFKQKDQAVFYIGPIPPEIARERLQRERAVELEYQPYVAQRPQVVVSPPPEWQVWCGRRRRPPGSPRRLVRTGGRRRRPGDAGRGRGAQSADHRHAAGHADSGGEPAAAGGCCHGAAAAGRGDHGAPAGPVHRPPAAAHRSRRRPRTRSGLRRPRQRRRQRLEREPGWHGGGGKGGHGWKGGRRR